MKLLFAFLVCVGIGYFAEIYFENPQKYIVWTGFTILTFGAYMYLTQITSFAFALPVTAVLVGVSSTFAYREGETAFIIFGIYGSIIALIFLGDKFIAWSWRDWKSPAKFMRALTATKHKK